MGLWSHGALRGVWHESVQRLGDWVRSPLRREASRVLPNVMRTTMHGATWDVGGSGLHGALCPTRHTAHDSDYQGLRPSHAHASPVPRPDGSVPQRPPDARKLLRPGAACHETKGQHEAHSLDVVGRTRGARAGASIGVTAPVTTR
jgi:hypothetical protein